MTPLQRMWSHSYALNDSLGEEVRSFVQSEFERCKNEVLDKVEAWVRESDGSSCHPPLDFLHECAREMSPPRVAHSRECFTSANDARLSGLFILLALAEHMPAELARRVLAHAEEQLAAAVSVVRAQLSAAVDRSIAQTRESREERGGSSPCIFFVPPLRNGVKQLKAFLEAGTPQRPLSLEWTPQTAEPKTDESETESESAESESAESESAESETAI